MIFKDRADAGRNLAARLTRYADRGDVLVLALPRGGVPVAYEVAKELKAPLDVFFGEKTWGARSRRTRKGSHCLRRGEQEYAEHIITGSKCSIGDRVGGSRKHFLRFRSPLTQLSWLRDRPG